jgi:translation initiation factor 2 subunit 2
MGSEEPLFDPSLKKRKKKHVAFSEDPLGPEADPTAPAPETIDNHTLNGDVVDLGTTTLHEQMKQSSSRLTDGEDTAGVSKEDDEFKAMFGDMKKKKKKKEIPIDLVRRCYPSRQLQVLHTFDRVKMPLARRHPPWVQVQA